MIRYGLYLLAAMFLGWTVYTSFTQVRSHERAVIRRFGRILDEKPTQGLHIGLPWGIDRVDLAPVGRVRNIDVGFNDKEEKDDEIVPAGQMLSGDHNLVNVRASIRFKVREEDMEKFVLHQDSVDAFVARAAESLLAEWIAARKIKDVLQRGKSELPPFLQAHLPDRLQEYGLGIEFEYASIPRLEPPDQVKDAFAKVTQAETNIRTQINQAEEKANIMKDIAEGKKKAIHAQAATYAKDERANAKSDAENFLKRLDLYKELAQQNPDYLNALWLDDMTRLFTRMKDGGRLELLEHFQSGGELSITQFPLLPRKK